MGFVEDKLSKAGEFLTGESAAGAAREAGRIQAEGAQAGINEIRASTQALRDLLGPLTGTLEQTLPALLGFTLDPNQQAAFAANNPLLQQLQEGISREVGRTTTQAQAARGKLGSGETQQRLQDQLSTSLIPVTLNEVQRRQNQLLGLTGIGTGALGMEAGALQSQGASIADLLGSQAAARAAGVVGAQNARQTGFNNLLGVGLGAGLGGAGLLGSGVGAGGGALLGALSDERTKENIKKLSELEEGIGVYMYNYVGDDETHIGVIAQEVEEVYPEAISEIDGIKVVNYEVLLNGHQSIDSIARSGS